MVSRTKLNRLLEATTGINRHTIDLIGVNLQKDELIKSGGRGPYAAKMDYNDLVTILIAVMGCDRANRAAGLVGVYSDLRSDKDEDVNLRQALSELLANRGLAEIVKKFSVCRSWPEASIYYGGRQVKFETKDRYLDPRTYQTNFRVDATISGEALYNLADIIADEGDLGDFGALKR
jgi:hypothetical protein